jgi:hypothetical protein
MTVVPDCPAGSGKGPTKCIPQKLIELDLKYQMRTCKYDLTGEEGKCVPACLVSDAGAIWLMRSECEAGELCVPCTDSISGQRSQACADRCVTP